jgi:hypothetical protein
MKLKKYVGAMAVLIIFTLIAVSISSCDTSDSDSLEQQIIGKWIYITETSQKSVYLISSFEFREDGSVSFSIDTTEAEGVTTDINCQQPSTKVIGLV